MGGMQELLARFLQKLLQKPHLINACLIEALLVDKLDSHDPLELFPREP